MPHPYPGQQWKHGWVPVTATAAVSKNHGKKPGKNNLLSRIAAEATARQQASKPAVKQPAPAKAVTKSAPVKAPASKPSPAPKAAPTKTAAPKAGQIPQPAPQTKKPVAPPAAKLQAAPTNTKSSSGMVGATRHETDADGVKWLERKMPDPKKVLTDKERRALRAYTADSYEHINEALRNRGERPDSQTQAEIAAIDAAMAKSATPEDVIVHRGTGAHFATRLGANIKDPASMRTMIGKDFVEDTYLSTSAGQQAAFGRDIQLMMRIPKGSRAINAMPISESVNERELLLDRGNRFVVHAAYESKGAWHVEIEMVPPTWKPEPNWKPSPAGNADRGYSTTPSAPVNSVDDLYYQDMLDEGFEV